MRLTILKNPFNTAERDIHDIVHIPGKTIEQYAQPYVMGLDEFVYACNGRVVEPDYVPGAGDYIAVCPVVGKKFGNFFGALLSVGLSVLTGNIASGKILGGIFKSSFLRGLVAAAVGFIGGQVINHLFPQPTVDAPDVPQSNPSYGWGGIQTQITQGGAVPITYGTMRTAGIELAKHIVSDGEKQYLYLLLCGGEGPADAVTDITINDNPVENYKDVEVDIRLGTNDQAVIENFGDTYSDQGLSYELTTEDWATQRTEGNAFEGLEVTFEFPSGLYHMNNDGNLENASVRVQAEYRPDGGEWLPWLDTTISDNKNTAIRRAFRLDHIAANRYEVRCKCISKSGTSTRDSTRIFWSQLSGIIYEPFSHPGKILIGIKALATEQLSGSDIAVTWRQTVEHVNVYNPQSKRYEQRSARNPAWVCYDILHRCKKLKNINSGKDEYVSFGGVKASQIDYQPFADWAEHCDYLKLNFEHIFDAASSLWDALKIPETFGRGKVIMKGTRFSCVCDKPSVPVQLFTVGNMVADKFSKEYMGITDRANAVEITFVNKEKDYQKDAITVYDEDWDKEDTYRNPTQVTLTGCTDFTQAYAHGKYLLRINRHMIRTCTWEADIDALACQVGDQVLVSHDVPQWGESGRILVATDNTLTLDRAVKMQEGENYSVVIRYADDHLETRGVVWQAEESDQIVLYEAFATPPKLDDLFAFGKVDREAKPFIVVDISRTNDLTATLTGIEYVPAVYEESLDAPVIDYNPGVSKYEVLSVSAKEETYHQADGTLVSNINVSWQLPRGAPNKAALFYSVDGGKTWRGAGTGMDEFAVIENVRMLVTYLVKVCAVSDLGVLSQGLIAEPLYITGKDTPPAAPSGLAAEEIEAGAMLRWNKNRERDLAGYNIYQRDKFGAAEWEIVTKGYGGTSLLIPLSEDAVYLFAVQAVDNCGNESELATTEFELAYPPDVEGFDVLQVDCDLDFRWLPVANCTYEIRAGTGWDYGNRVAQVSNCFLKTIYPIPGDHKFWIKARNKYKRYSKNPVAAEIALLGDNERNAIYTLRYAGDDWRDSHLNFHVTSDGLELDRDAMFGEYTARAELPKKYVARNWINAHVVGTTDDCVTWDEALFSWDAVEAEMPWLPSGDITGVTVQQQIAIRNDAIPADILESYPLDGDARGELHGGVVQEEKHVAYELARYGQGAYIGDLTKLSWPVSIPAVFHLAFFMRLKTKLEYDAVFMTFVGQNKLFLGYDYIKDVFYIEDNAGRRNEVRQDHRSRDYLAVAIVQTPTQRSLYVSSFATQSAGQSTENYAAAGGYTAVYCYKK